MEAGAPRMEITRIAAPWWTWLVAALVTIGVGIVVLFEPGKSLKALAVILGIYLLLDGVVAFINAARDEVDERGLAVIHGVVSLILGIVLVRHPVQSLTAIALLIALWLLSVGCMGFVEALRTPGHRGLRLLLAAVQIAAGVVIIANPKIGYGTLAIVTGIALVLQGLAMAALAFALRRAAPA